MKVEFNDPLPFIVVVIVHWINLDDTVECLESLSIIDYPHFSIILVNNGSPDFDIERVYALFPDLLTVKSNENMGFSGGCNLGIKKALENGADLIFLLNNDTVVHPNLFTTQIAAMTEPEIGILGPVIESYFEPKRVWFAGGSYNRLLGFSYRQRPLAPFEKKTVDWISGCSMLVRREVFEAIGTLWEPFFLNCEDLDFCLRASRENFKCVQIGEPLVRHKISASGGILGTDLFSKDKAYYFARNFLLLLRNNSRGLWTIPSILSQFLVVLPFWLIYCIVMQNTEVIPSYLAGLWDGIQGRTGRR